MSDSKQKYVAVGTIAFSNIVERDTYKNKPTKYGVTLTLDNAEAAKLEALGVIVSQYEGNGQRKFTTDYKDAVMPVDVEGNPLWVKDVDAGFELPRGTSVRIWYTLTPNDDYGQIPYIGGLRVLELAEAEAPEEF